MDLVNFLLELLILLDDSFVNGLWDELRVLGCLLLLRIVAVDIKLLKLRRDVLVHVHQPVCALPRRVTAFGYLEHLFL